MKKILLVDNIRPILEREKGLLDRDIFQIFTATSGQEALEVHKKEKADIIVMSLHMSGMGGDEVCRAIRQDPELKHVSIILSTLLNDEKEIERCKACGANDYIKKPIDRQELAEKVAKLLGIPARQSIRILIKIKIEGRLGSEFFMANTVDVSINGLLFECERDLSVGDSIVASFFLLGAAEFNRVVARSEVMRVAKSGTKMKRYGVRFLDFKEGNPALIGDFIKRKTGKT
jgi:CheY-like chemotaxis protein